MSLWPYFYDPILWGPTIGCILLCSAASLLGVILFFQRRLMVSESISHAAYPGAIAGIFALSFLGPEFEEWSFLAILLGALVSSWAGLKLIALLERKWKIPSDAALCFVLSFFFGGGVLLASWLQQTHPFWMNQVQTLLFGQAATLSDGYVAIYSFLALVSILFVVFAFYPLRTFLFDPIFARAVGLSTRTIERIFLCLLLVAIVTGIRSAGIILISGMLIGPAVAARQFSHRLKIVFFLAALFGAFSGFAGNVLSVEIALRNDHWHLPTGPMIVLVSTTLALIGLLFSPARGLFFRMLRLAFFRLRCLEENVLKGLWSKGPMGKNALKRRYPTMTRFVLFRLLQQGWIIIDKLAVHLTQDGKAKASEIVRLHRLWELYLTEQLGHTPDRVHRSAEEMEHILTPELEERLTRLLANPQVDPHQQPIPERRGL